MGNSSRTVTVLSTLTKGLIEDTLLDECRSFFLQLELNDLSQDAFLGAISRLPEERVGYASPQGSEAADLTFLKTCAATW